MSWRAWSNTDTMLHWEAVKIHCPSFCFIPTGILLVFQIMFYKQTSEIAEEEHRFIFLEFFPTAFCNTISFWKLKEKPINKGKLDSKF